MFFIIFQGGINNVQSGTVLFWTFCPIWDTSIKKFLKSIDKTKIWYIIGVSNKSLVKNLRRKNNGRKHRKKESIRGSNGSN